MPVKLDVAVSVVSVDAVNWKVVLTVPAYDLSTYNQLAEIRVYLVSEGVEIPTTAQAYVDAAPSLPVAIEDVAAYQTGVEVETTLPEVGAGKYMGRIVLGFAE